MGGDYGFAWNPHGDYARELTFFVKYVGFSPLDVITCGHPDRSRDHGPRERRSARSSPASSPTC